MKSFFYILTTATAVLHTVYCTEKKKWGRITTNNHTNLVKVPQYRYSTTSPTSWQIYYIIYYFNFVFITLISGSAVPKLIDRSSSQTLLWDSAAARKQMQWTLVAVDLDRIDRQLRPTTNGCWWYGYMCNFFSFIYFLNLSLWCFQSC